MRLCDHNRKILTNLSSFHILKNHNETQILTKESFGPYWIQINLQCIAFRSKKVCYFSMILSLSNGFKSESEFES